MRIENEGNIIKSRFKRYLVTYKKIDLNPTANPVQFLKFLQFFYPSL